MSNFETTKFLIQEMSGTGERTLAVSKSFLEFTGSLDGGVFLSQVIFFSDKSSRNDGYFWKTYDEWKDHTFMTEYSIRKQVKYLKDLGVLETAVKMAHGKPTVHYKFKMNEFIELFSSFLRNQRNEPLDSKEPTFGNEDSLTEITTEITTKNNISSDKSEVDKVIEKYKEMKNLPGFNKITPTRKKAINARIREEGIEKVIAILEKLNQDEYYIQAKNDGLNWYKFDYVFNPTKFNMLIERFDKKSQSNYSTNQHQGASSYVVQDKDLYGDVE